MMNKSKTKKNLLKSWIDAYSIEMFRFTITKVSSKEEAEDLIQDTFLSAFKGIDNFKAKSSPKTWLYSILKNKIFDYYRKKYKSFEMEEVEINTIDDYKIYFDDKDTWKKQFQTQDWPEQTNNNLLTDFLQNCMKLLPSQWFILLQLKYFENINTEKICQDLSISKTNYWQLMHRARLQLRACIENEFKNQEK